MIQLSALAISTRDAIEIARDAMVALATDQQVNYKVRKHLSGAVTRLNNALSYMEENLQSESDDTNDEAETLE